MKSLSKGLDNKIQFSKVKNMLNTFKKVYLIHNNL